MIETVHDSDTKQFSLPPDVAADSVTPAYGHARRDIDVMGYIFQMTYTKSASERVRSVVGGSHLFPGVQSSTAFCA